jgi:hypothetical protein
VNEILLTIADMLSAVSDTVSKTLRKSIFLFWAFAALCLVTGLVYGLVDSLAPSESVEAAASRLGFEPSFNGLADYINKSIKPGMTREEVERVLRNIGPLTAHRGRLEQIDSGWGPTACDDLVLHMSWTIPLSTCYDTEDRLVLMQGTGSDALPVIVYAPRRQ